MSGTQLTPSRFDRMAGAVSAKIIWTLPKIGERIGASPDFVRDTLMKATDTPIRSMGGRFYALEDDLIAFMRSDRNKPL